MIPTEELRDPGVEIIRHPEVGGLISKDGEVISIGTDSGLQNLAAAAWNAWRGERHPAQSIKDGSRELWLEYEDSHGPVWTISNYAEEWWICLTREDLHEIAEQLA